MIGGMQSLTTVQRSVDMTSSWQKIGTCRLARQILDSLELFANIRTYGVRWSSSNQTEAVVFDLD